MFVSFWPILRVTYSRLICFANQSCSMAHAWPGAACWIKLPIHPPSANKWIILAVSAMHFPVQHYTSLLDQKELSEHWFLCVVCLPSPSLSWLFCLTLHRTAETQAPSPTPTHPPVHPSRCQSLYEKALSLSFRHNYLYIITIDGGLQRGTGELTRLTLSFQQAEGKGDRWWI